MMEDGVGLRDSKNPDEFLVLSRDAWSDFVNSIKGGFQPS